MVDVGAQVDKLTASQCSERTGELQLEMSQNHTRVEISGPTSIVMCGQVYM